MAARNKAASVRIKRKLPLPLVIVLIASLAALSVAVPAAIAQGTTTVGTINTGVANVSIVSGAQNPNNGVFYSPASITVVIGVNNTVVWTNHDTTNHTVVAVDNSYSDTLAPGQTFTHTYTTAGVYNYHCTIHTFMMGSVKVLAAPSSSTTSTSSSGGIPEFPFEGVVVIAVTAVVLASYLLVRQTRRG